jgi:hypothetical protein
MLKPSLIEQVSISIYGKTVRKNGILYNFVTNLAKEQI